MLDRLAALLGVSPSVVGALLALVAVQLGLQTYGLVDLARRSRVVGGRKWPWALVIVAGTVVGAVVYLAVGRRAAAPTGAEATDRGTDERTVRRAVDELYGPEDRQ